MDANGPPATGQRIDWADAPAWLRAEVEARLGGRVVEAVTQPTGFSPGLAARLRLADGRRAFVKAVGPEPNPDSPGFHRTEARIMAALPRSAPAPRLLWSLDPWAVRHLDRLAELEAGWPRATSTGCAAGPAGADRPRALEEGPAQLLQPGCRPLGACRKLAEPIEPPGPHEPLTIRRGSGISGAGRAGRSRSGGSSGHS
jgi:hypothetical protein